MNIGKSIKKALENNGQDAVWLAKRFGCSKQHVHQLIRSYSANGNTIDKLAEAFELEASEFIKLGE